MSRIPKASYRIGAVSKLTGLSSHTIRVWERRYKAVVPTRTPGGTREYSAADLEKLTMLRTLSEAGHSIGGIAALDMDTLRGLLGDAAGRDSSSSIREHVPAVEAVLGHILELDLAAAERELLNASAVIGPLTMIFDVIAPLVEEVGRRWETGEFRVVHEHAATAALRTLLGHFLSSHAGRPKQALAVTATVSGERHELGALMASFIAVTRGYSVLYMGPDLPVADICHVAKKKDADLVLISVVNAYSKEAEEQFMELKEGLGSSLSILVGGRAQASYSHIFAPEERVSSLQDLHDRLKPIGPKLALVEPAQ